MVRSSRGKKVNGRFVEKICKTCGLLKLREDYYLRKGMMMGANCKQCEMKRRNANPNPRDPLHKHDHWLRMKYGIRLSDYYAMLEAQGGKCKICSRTEPSRGHRWFDVDHCHKTGKVRGILCTECNHGIGALKDNPTILESALRYLVAHSWQISTN